MFHAERLRVGEVRSGIDTPPKESRMGGMTWMERRLLSAFNIIIIDYQ